MNSIEYITDLLKRHNLFHVAPPELIGELVHLKTQADLASTMTDKYLAAIEAMDPEKILELHSLARKIML